MGVKANGYLRSVVFVVALLSLVAVWMGWRAAEREKAYVVRRRDIASKLDSAASVARGWPAVVSDLDTLKMRVTAIEGRLDEHLNGGWPRAEERP